MVPTSAKPRLARVVLSVFTLVMLLLAASVAAAPGAGRTDSPPDCKPGPEPRAACAPARGGPTTGVTTMGRPAPGSKNASTPPARDPAGITRSGLAAAGPKGASAAAEPVTTAGDGDRQFRACGASGGSGWTTTSAELQVIRSCTLTLPEDGFVYIAATASVALSSGGTAFEARFRLSVDENTSGNDGTDRWVNIYPDSGDGTDKSVAVTMLTSVISGTHTFNFLGARFAGDGTTQLYAPSLSVLFFPSSSAEVLSCGVAGNLTWSTNQTTFQTIRSCTLNVPQSGFVFVNGTASAGLVDTPYEARFRLGVDSVTGSASTDRWVNVYTDSGDGTDETVETSFLSSVAAGAHTFYFLGTHYNGTGTVQLYDPTLSVLYFPATNSTVNVCGANGSDVWTNNTTSYTIIRSCTLNVPQDSFAFVDASASSGLNAVGAGNEWEGQFTLGVDNTNGSSLFNRWINVYNDTGDGTDRTLADSGVVNVSRGAHTFYFLGRRYAGAGTLRLYSPSLTVLVPGATVFLAPVYR